MSAVRADLTVRSPFRLALQDFLDTHDEFISEWESFPGTDRPATVAEVVGNRQLVHSMRLRYGGTYLRILDAELGAGNRTPAIRAERARLGALRRLVHRGRSRRDGHPDPDPRAGRRTARSGPARGGVGQAEALSRTAPHPGHRPHFAAFVSRKKSPGTPEKIAGIGALNYWHISESAARYTVTDRPFTKQ
ncbi:hypothetical protein [Streptosporangium roseum]|uniref:hypothetical protein n=1 Tax=Streptosporangium roseum TaxID=2001 RepID=UPI0001A39B6A|nr:hypothetical protein [Streptosporangium roseum]